MDYSGPTNEDDTPPPIVSGGDEEEEIKRLPWGCLPAEQYLIRNWNYSAEVSNDEQCRQLIRNFLTEDSFPYEWDPLRDHKIYEPLDRTPTEDEINIILAPWRPLRWRAAAARLWMGRHPYAIWLRTYYKDTDEQFKEWIEVDEENDEWDSPDSVWWRLLDDETLFSFGESLDEYIRVFDMIPELAGPQHGNARVLEGPSFEALADDEYVKELRAALREDVRKAADKEAVVHNGDNGVNLQMLSTDSWLLVADKEAFETDQPLVLFVDAKGNIVRYARISVDDIYNLRTPLTIAHLDFHKFWNPHSTAEDGTPPFSNLGKKYEMNGEIGRTLYGVEDLVSHT